MASCFTLDSDGIYDGSNISGALFTTGLDMGNTLQLIFAILLLILGVLVAIQGVKKLFEKQKA